MAPPVRPTFVYFFEVVYRYLFLTEVAFEITLLAKLHTKPMKQFRLAIAWKRPVVTPPPHFDRVVHLSCILNASAKCRCIFEQDADVSTHSHSSEISIDTAIASSLGSLLLFPKIVSFFLPTLHPES
jgi:hypothetical protein